MRLISIHAPLAGSDNCSVYPDGELVISIHAPLAGSDPGVKLDSLDSLIFQSTLPLRGATNCLLYDRIQIFEFQSTLPLRGATSCEKSSRVSAVISIHAPLAGSDPAAAGGHSQH